MMLKLICCVAEEWNSEGISLNLVISLGIPTLNGPDSLQHHCSLPNRYIFDDEWKTEDQFCTAIVAGWPSLAVCGSWSPLPLGLRCQMRLLQLNGTWSSAIPVPGDKKMKVKLILIEIKLIIESRNPKTLLRKVQQYRTSKVNLEWILLSTRNSRKSMRFCKRKLCEQWTVTLLRWENLFYVG